MDCTAVDNVIASRDGFLLGFAKKDLTKVYPYQTNSLTLNNILKDQMALTAVDLRYHSYSISRQILNNAHHQM